MKYYFLDESGNTGDIAQPNFITVYKDQPIFSLACVGTNDLQKLNDFGNNLIKKYKIQSNEIKSKSVLNSSRYIQLVKDIIDFFIKDKNIFIEVVNKKYQLCATFVTYFIFHPCVFNVKNISEELVFIFIRAVSTYIYYKITDEQLNVYISLYTTNESESDKIIA